jgi:thiosulfate/3-mercaptopyruvate sulfurtransferase
VRYQFVDCRWELGNPERGREVYLEGHVPGASFLDVDADLSDLTVPDAGRHPLPSAEEFATAAGRAGIGDGVFVVAYGSGGGPERLWWLLRHFGHDDCAVLLGGIEEWGGELRAGEEPIEPAELVPQEREGDTIAAEEIARRLADPSLALMDARVASRWRGEPNEIDDPAGRIPGAANAPWNEPLPELPLGELVAYCGSGVTACVTLHRAWLAGREGRLYPGSWSEWSQRRLPLESGEGSGCRAAPAEPRRAAAPHRAQPPSRAPSSRARSAIPRA